MGAMESLASLGLGWKLEALYLPRFPDSCSVFFHAAMHFALLIIYAP